MRDHDQAVMSYKLRFACVLITHEAHPQIAVEAAGTCQVLLRKSQQKLCVNGWMSFTICVTIELFETCAGDEPRPILGGDE